MSNEHSRSNIRKSDANVSHLLRNSALYNGGFSHNDDPADALTRFSTINAVRLA